MGFLPKRPSILPRVSLASFDGLASLGRKRGPSERLSDRPAQRPRNSIERLSDSMTSLNEVSQTAKPTKRISPLGVVEPPLLTRLPLGQTSRCVSNDSVSRAADDDMACDDEDDTAREARMSAGDDDEWGFFALSDFSSHGSPPVAPQQPLSMRWADAALGLTSRTRPQDAKTML
eukprot:CAMPEP_0184129116 /NCGR_PEP_ID=MMETSP0974-20121125/26923_1 /TAXON_ID=483370 /ORGANISM="non described non described, Strain CCMP2097" /LENGTH=174 /DNA_ID=CAMNT_0026432547 /DNA_START=92 /DNA_END=618 /DNA_ORIENTATION=-